MLMARRSKFENEEVRKLVDKLSITLENGKPLSPRKISVRLKSEHDISITHVTIGSYLKNKKQVVNIVKEEIKKEIPVQVKEATIVESELLDVRNVFSENETLLKETIDFYASNPLVVLKAISTRSINAARYGAIFGTDENRKIVELQDRYRHIIENILNAVKTHEKDQTVLHNINLDLDNIRDEFSNV